MFSVFDTHQFLMAGLYLSVFLTFGSLAVLIYLRGKDRFVFRKAIVPSKSNHNQSGPFMTIHKIVPNFVFQKSVGAEFQKIQTESNTLIYSKSFKYKPESEDRNEDRMGNRQIRLFPGINNEFRYLTIEGYKTGVQLASDLLDKLLQKCGRDQFQVFQVRTSQVGCLIGTKGASIKRIMKNTGTDVKIVQQSSLTNRQSLTTINIYGNSLEQTREAFRAIDSHLGQDRRVLSRNQPVRFVDDEDEERDEEEMKEAHFVRCQTIGCYRNNCTHHSSNSRVRTWNRNRQPAKTRANFTEGFPIGPSISSTAVVFVSYVVSPFEIYLHLNDRLSQLEQLYDQMDQFYQQESNRRIHRYQPDCPELGNGFVAAIFEEQIEEDKDVNEEEEENLHFCRALVLDVIKSLDPSASSAINQKKQQQVQCKLFYLDIGQTVLCNLDQVFHLNDEFVDLLPFQAIPCQLYGVKPPSEVVQDKGDKVDKRQNGKTGRASRQVATSWTADSTDGLRSLVSEGLSEVPFLVRCYGTTEPGQITKHLVELFRDEKCQISVAQEMIELGLAEPIQPIE